MRDSGTMVVIRSKGVSPGLRAGGGLKPITPDLAAQVLGFPRPPGRGRIETASTCMSGLGMSSFPRPPGRGRIETTADSTVLVTRSVSFPRPPGRGRIETGAPRAARRGTPVSPGLRAGGGLKPLPGGSPVVRVAVSPGLRAGGGLKHDHRGGGVAGQSRFPRPPGRGRIETGWLG